MLIVLLSLGFIAMIVAGHIVYAKAPKGEEVSTIHFWGYGLLAVLMVIVSIVHFCTVGSAINLESQYYTYYTYSQNVQDNVLIIPISSLEGKLIPEGSANQPSDTVSINKVRADIFYYNQNLYAVRHWGVDPFVGLIIEKPDCYIKPIVLR